MHADAGGAVTRVSQGRDGDAGQVREQARRDVEQAREQARAAARQAAEEEARTAIQESGHPVPPVPPVPPVGPGSRPTVIHGEDGELVITTEDGKTVVVRNPEDIAAAVGAQFPPPMGIPPQAVAISIAFFILLAVIIVGWPIARAFGRRMDRATGSPALPREVDERLQRLEQAVDTIAVEVERIAEGQRYASRLLSEIHPVIATPARAPALAERGGPDTP